MARFRNASRYIIYMKAATKQTIKSVVDEAWQGEALNELKNYVRMPCKSKDFDVDWETNGFLLQVCRNAAAWGRRLFPEAVFEVLTEPGRTPALFFDIPASGKDNEKAVFFYGHFDKQPEGEGWRGSPLKAFPFRGRCRAQRGG